MITQAIAPRCSAAPVGLLIDDDRSWKLLDLERGYQLGSGLFRFATPPGRADMDVADRRILLAYASWDSAGVYLAELPSGSLRWERTDIRRVLSVAVIGTGRLVVVTMESGRTMFLDIESGSTKFEIRSGQGVVAASDRLAVVRADFGVRLLDLASGASFARLPLDNSAVLAGAVSPDRVLLTDTHEWPEPTHAWLLARDGQLVMSTTLEAGRNSPWVAYDANSEHWLMVSHDPNRVSTPVLHRLAADGKAIATTGLGASSDYAFASKGRLLLSSTTVTDTRTGGSIPLNLA